MTEGKHVQLEINMTKFGGDPAANQTNGLVAQRKNDLENAHIKVCEFGGLEV